MFWSYFYYFVFTCFVDRIENEIFNYILIYFEFCEKKKKGVSEKGKGEGGKFYCLDITCLLSCPGGRWMREDEPSARLSVLGPFGKLSCKSLRTCAAVLRSNRSRVWGGFQFVNLPKFLSQLHLYRIFSGISNRIISQNQ